MTTDRTATVVEVTRSGRWWAIRVPSMPSVFSQCRRLDQVDEFAREAIALAADVGPDEVGELDTRTEPPADVAALVNDARTAADAARAASAHATDARRTAAAELAARGYTTRDIGALLGLSHQRVSQLLADTG